MKEEVKYFNPQVPCGTRRCRHSVKKSGRLGFQSTGPLRDPTTLHVPSVRTRFISIHRSLAGPDSKNKQNNTVCFCNLYNRTEKFIQPLLITSHDCVFSLFEIRLCPCEQDIHFPLTCCSHSKHQQSVRMISLSDSKMFNLSVRPISQIVKSEAILLFLHNST